jgi:hypothetical protein
MSGCFIDAARVVSDSLRKWSTAWHHERVNVSSNQVGNQVCGYLNEAASDFEHGARPAILSIHPDRYLWASANISFLQWIGGSRSRSAVKPAVRSNLNICLKECQAAAQKSHRPRFLGAQDVIEGALLRA